MLGRTFSADVLNALNEEEEAAKQYLAALHTKQLRYAHALACQEHGNYLTETHWQQLETATLEEQDAFNRLFAAREASIDTTTATL